MNMNIPQPTLNRSDRWEALKPEIEQLWLVKRWKLADIVKHMMLNHQHHANEREYRNKFQQWNWKKNVPKKTRANVIDQFETRAKAGKSSSTATYGGHTIEQNKIRRWAKDKSRTDAKGMILGKLEGLPPGSVVPFTNSFFLKWNMPYEALIGSSAGAFNYSSPQGISDMSPASDTIVATPSSAMSPPSAPSPTAVAIKRKTAMERAKLFVQGRHDALLADMNRTERRQMSNWLYQYWFFCFKTAKHWGKGPLHWTHDLLEFEKYCTPSQQSLPATPQDVMETVNHHHNDRLAPTQDCRWLIHVAPVEHEGWYDSPRFEQGSEQDTENNWDEDQMREPIAARFRNALEHNDFCAESASKLPVAIPSIAKAAEKAPDELMVEAWAFCIMSRNAEEAIQIYRQARQQKISFHHIHPLHLIINYLDGYKSCCDILRDFTGLIDTKTMGELWLNEWGHTVLDSLMISILKSHSTATPGIVDGKLKTVMRFVGEEVDICGRWDADSPCLRQLFARGESVIPSDWKHKFCHTSVQTVIHCMDSVLERVPERCVTEEPSGLYSRQCFGCGTTLKLQPLHCLVLTAFNLARYAVDAKEDLFGMLACLLCMVSNGIDPTTRATVAVDLLLGPDTTQELCDHKNLTAAELAIELSILVDTQYWSATIQSGWLVFCGVLQLCEANHIDTDLDEHDEDSEFIFGSNTGQSGYQVLKYTHYDHLLRMPRSPRFRSCKDLATLWASMQAEVLSYRRLSEDMDWTSQYFSMEDLRIQLNSGAVLEVGYATKNLLKTHCICGRLPGFPLTILANATNPDIANLDVWDRATYS